MNRKKVEKILADTAYVRVSGTEEEKRCVSLGYALGIPSPKEAAQPGEVLLFRRGQ